MVEILCEKADEYCESKVKENEVVICDYCKNPLPKNEGGNTCSKCWRQRHGTN